MIFRAIRNKNVQHSVVVFGGVVIASIFNYLYFMLIARRAGVETYGVVTALASATLVLLTPGIIGQLIAARLAADLEERADRGALSSLAATMSRYAAFAGGGVFAVALIFAHQLSAFFNIIDITPVLVSALALGLYGVVAVQRGVLQGSHRFSDFAASTSIDAVIKVAVGVPLVGTFGVTGALSGITAAAGITLLYNSIVLRRHFGVQRTPIRLDRDVIRHIALQVGLSQLVFTVLTFYDVPLVEHAFDAKIAGIYAAAAIVGRAIYLAVSFLPTLLMPKTSARAASGRSPLPLFWLAIGFAALIVALSSLVAAVAPRFVVVVFSGNAFVNATSLVLPYIAASGALALANVVSSYKMGLHQYDFVVPCVTIALCEVLTVAFWHPSIRMVVTVLVSGNTLLFLSTLFGVWTQRSNRRPAVSSSVV